MVYVVAAYSITVSVLLIYGVLLQHRARVARARLTASRDPASSAGAGLPSAADAGRGFNLGAALLAPFWAWAHGQRMAAAMLLGALAALAAAQTSGLRLAVVLLGPLLLGASLFFGVVGNRIAAARAEDRDPIATAQAQLAWALAGAVLYTIVLPWACYFGLGPR